MYGKKIQAEVISPDDLPGELLTEILSSPDHTYRSDNKIYFFLNETVFCCPDDSAGNELACAVMLRRGGKGNKPDSAEETLEMMLRDPNCQPDRSLLLKHGISLSGCHAAVVFRSFSPLDREMADLFRFMVPVEEKDCVVRVDYMTAALIREQKEQMSGDLIEFSEAAIGTMEEEGISGIRAGIGGMAPDVPGIRKSYREAGSALFLGMKYHPEERVYIYEKQTLERMIESIPADKRKEIRDGFFSRRFSGTYNDEMLETVKVFFRNDLNLTAASKQLFIHRNTLNYRLDKIKKETGLDLRSFEDAAVFRIVSLINAEE